MDAHLVSAQLSDSPVQGICPLGAVILVGLMQLVDLQYLFEHVVVNFGVVLVDIEAHFLILLLLL